MKPVYFLFDVCISYVFAIYTGVKNKGRLPLQKYEKIPWDWLTFYIFTLLIFNEIDRIQDQIFRLSYLGFTDVCFSFSQNNDFSFHSTKQIHFWLLLINNLVDKQKWVTKAEPQRFDRKFLKNKHCCDLTSFSFVVHGATLGTKLTLAEKLKKNRHRLDALRPPFRTFSASWAGAGIPPRQGNRAKKHRARQAHYSTEFFAPAGWGNSWGIVGYCTLSSAGDWVSDSEAHRGKIIINWFRKLERKNSKILWKWLTNIIQKLKVHQKLIFSTSHF